MNLGNVPEMLRKRNQWVLWKNIHRGGKPTKVPFQISGDPAKAGDPTTWAPFDSIAEKAGGGTYDGVGFEFDKTDPFCGVDLDGCRDPETGKVADWAREIILDLNTYAEVSPSETGVKLFLVGKWSMSSGKKVEIDGEPAMGGKTAAVEVYDWGRYFAVTGLRLTGPAEPQERQDALDRLAKRFWPVQDALPFQDDYRSEDAVCERARKYLSAMPAAVAGRNGHKATFHTACVLVLGFGLDESVALRLLGEYNQRCEPAWTEKELIHKVHSASKQSGERNYLRNASIERWKSITIPPYKAPPIETESHEPQVTTLLSSAQKYLDIVRAGQSAPVETGLPDLDAAIGGGVEYGEMVILAARPSHGKSAAALQCVHEWTKQNCPVLVISEEMSALALGKRTLQFLTSIPQEHWQTSIEGVEADLATHFESRAECYVVESCGTVEAVVRQIEKHVENHGVRHVVVDYAQLLTSVGGSRYERVTNTSIALRQCASKQNIVLLLLCQLSREIEGRQKFIPMMSDIKETGQLEQDADVIVFLVWPHKLNPSEPPGRYQFFIAKNRNRPINSPVVVCEFIPSRQMLVTEKPKYTTQQTSNYEPSFDSWND